MVFIKRYKFNGKNQKINNLRQNITRYKKYNKIQYNLFINTNKIYISFSHLKIKTKH